MRELPPIDDETMEYIATPDGIGAHPKKVERTMSKKFKCAICKKEINEETEAHSVIFEHCKPTIYEHRRCREERER